MNNPQNPNNKPKILIFRLPPQFGLTGLQSILAKPTESVDDFQTKVDSLASFLQKRLSPKPTGVDRGLLHKAFERKLPEETPALNSVESMLKGIFMKHAPQPSPANKFSGAEVLFPNAGSELLDEVQAGWSDKAESNISFSEVLSQLLNEAEDSACGTCTACYDTAEAEASGLESPITMFPDVSDISGVLTVEVEGIDTETILDFLHNNVQYLKGQYPDANISVVKTIRD